jgi:N-hydroxyarylamine O-acetyltransferase
MEIKNLLINVDINNTDDLNTEIKSYLDNYSFSTLDILLSEREILSLEIEDLYKKIIIDRRGGYCFEHNKLFHYFLENRGFEVTKQLARVVYGKDIDAPRTHRINIVKIDGNEYLADVGFGAHTPNALIPMDGKEVKCPSEKIYRVKENEKGLFHLEVLREEGFFTFYTFDMGIYTEADFKLASYFSNTHPNSKHAYNLVLSINKNQETNVILNKTLTVFKGDSKIEENISSSDLLKRYLKEIFMINISQQEADFLFKKFED